MASRATNLAILVLLALEFASGVGGFLVGRESGSWVFWLHSLGGLVLVVLIFAKTGIARASFSRRPTGPWAALPLLLAALILGALVSGLLWSTVGLPEVPIPFYGDVSGLTLHVVLAVAALPLAAAHLVLRPVRPRRIDLASRRAVLRHLGTAAGGLVAWQALEAGTRVLELSGASRRFTGSRAEASFEGNAHPVTNWLTDRRQRLDAATWRLELTGAVAGALTLDYPALLEASTYTRRALLDCTGGWYTEQHWRGVPLGELLARARPLEAARSLVVCSATGYDRRFDLAAAPDLLLATHVEESPLSAAHGFPLRLVAPGHRGYHWVKWVTTVEVSERPSWWQPPLPLQ